MVENCPENGLVLHVGIIFFMLNPFESTPVQALCNDLFGIVDPVTSKKGHHFPVDGKPVLLVLPAFALLQPLDVSLWISKMDCWRIHPPHLGSMISQRPAMFKSDAGIFDG
jgi:hypothetical protein